MLRDQGEVVQHGVVHEGGRTAFETASGFRQHLVAHRPIQQGKRRARAKALQAKRGEACNEERPEDDRPRRRSPVRIECDDDHGRRHLRDEKARGGPCHGAQNSRPDTDDQDHRRLHQPHREVVVARHRAELSSADDREPGDAGTPDEEVARANERRRAAIEKNEQSDHGRQHDESRPHRDLGQRDLQRHDDGSRGHKTGGRGGVPGAHNGERRGRAREVRRQPEGHTGSFRRGGVRLFSGWRWPDYRPRHRRSPSPARAT